MDEDGKELLCKCYELLNRAARWTSNLKAEPDLRMLDLFMVQLALFVDKKFALGILKNAVVIGCTPTPPPAPPPSEAVLDRDWSEKELAKIVEELDGGGKQLLEEFRSLLIEADAWDAKPRKDFLGVGALYLFGSLICVHRDLPQPVQLSDTVYVLGLDPGIDAEEWLERHRYCIPVDDSCPRFVLSRFKPRGRGVCSVNTTTNTLWGNVWVPTEWIRVRFTKPVPLNYIFVGVDREHVRAAAPVQEDGEAPKVWEVRQNPSTPTSEPCPVRATDWRVKLSPSACGGLGRICEEFERESVVKSAEVELIPLIKPLLPFTKTKHK